MTSPPSLYRILRLANAVVFAAGLALAFDHSVAAALGRFEGGHHWATGRRVLVLVDRTGDPAWHDATRRAAEVWNRAAGGTGLRLRWETGTGPCEADGPRIGFCLARQADLGDQEHADRHGVARVLLGRSHTAGAVVELCRDCRLDDARRRVIAAHEVGHVLGLPHSPRERSVMHALGGTEAPDAVDREALRRLYDHVDGEEDCGVLDLEVGALCF
jgi:hypothetical protein